MTPRERAIVAARGGEVDRKPTIGGVGADILVARNAEPDHDRIVVAAIDSPFWSACKRGIDLNRAFEENPSDAADLLAREVEQVRREAAEGFQAGADGVFYILGGAHPDFTSPMQYGGHYLEADREILAELAGATLNVLYVKGGEGVYLDFVSDLPADVFAWQEAAGVSVATMRKVRSGALATSGGAADFVLALSDSLASDLLQEGALETV